ENEEQPNCLRKSICKLHVMKKMLKQLSINPDKTLAVGDSLGDLCIIKQARIGVAFRPKHPELIKAADIVIHSDFYELTEKLKSFLEMLKN
ncbi:HAD hydrolase family protein, partial [Candidatus Bathyarchaeota archaeon]|nr:HAD hydrolase family protein [Candidatus Bathyarchaeota archaeon]